MSGGLNRVVVIVSSALDDEEVDTLRRECDKHRTGTDLSELGASIDLFENSKITETHPARYDCLTYIHERFRENNQQGYDIGDREIIAKILLQKLPSIAAAVSTAIFGFNSKDWFLFNESYVVKESDSNLAFRWHIDSEEQLSTFAVGARPIYFSSWCPLDSVTSSNGTVAFHTSVRIVRLQYDSHSQSLSLLSCSPLLSNENEAVAVTTSSGSSFTAVASTTVCSEIIHDDPNGDNSDDDRDGSGSDDEHGLELELSPGEVLLFSSTIDHRSGINETSTPRRVFYAQYSPTVISPHAPGSSSSSCSMSSVGNNSPLSFAIPCEVHSISCESSCLIREEEDAAPPEEIVLDDIGTGTNNRPNTATTAIHCYAENDLKRRSETTDDSDSDRLIKRSKATAVAVPHVNSTSI